MQASKPWDVVAFHMAELASQGLKVSEGLNGRSSMLHSDCSGSKVLVSTQTLYKEGDSW